MSGETTYAAIPTKYGGVQFRSRLEAKWAAFFDRMGWPWEYEPFDLDGYIPDFVLGFYKPLLVEVKPFITPEAKTKIARSGWRQDALIVGSFIEADDIFRGASIGHHGEFGEWTAFEEGQGALVTGHAWGPAIFQTCRKCGRNSLFNGLMTYTCLVSGCYEGNHFIGPEPLWLAQTEFRAAGNAVQWRPPAA